MSNPATALCSLHPAARIAGLLLAMLFLVVGCGDDGESAGAGSDSASQQGALSSDGELTMSQQVRVLADTASSQLPPEIRIFAVQQLGAIGTPDTLPVLAEALGDPDPQIAYAAVMALPETKDAAVLAGLRTASKSKDSKVSRAAEARLRKLD